MKFYKPNIRSYSNENLIEVISAHAGCNSIGKFICDCYGKCNDHIITYDGGKNCW